MPQKVAAAYKGESFEVEIVCFVCLAGGF